MAFSQPSAGHYLLNIFSKVKLKILFICLVIKFLFPGDTFLHFMFTTRFLQKYNKAIYHLYRAVGEQN